MEAPYKGTLHNIRQVVIMLCLIRRRQKRQTESRVIRCRFVVS